MRAGCSENTHKGPSAQTQEDLWENAGNVGKGVRGDFLMRIPKLSPERQEEISQTKEASCTKVQNYGDITSLNRLVNCEHFLFQDHINT